MPLGKDIGKNLEKITDEHPDWPRKRRIAASLNAARAHGAKITSGRRGKPNGKRKRKGRVHGRATNR